MEDDEGSSSCSIMSSQSTNRTERELTTGVTMNQTGFLPWQQRFHEQQRHEQQRFHEQQAMLDTQQPLIGDSQLQLGVMGAGSPGDGDSQHQTQFTTDEEFARLMQGPMPGYVGLMQDVTLPLQDQQFNSCPASIPSAGNSMANVPSGRKKRAPKPAAPKPKKSKTTPILIDDDGEGEDSGTTCRWSEEEVQQLIAFRQELDEEFERNAKKQGKLEFRVTVIFCGKRERLSRLIRATRQRFLETGRRLLRRPLPKTKTCLINSPLLLEFFKSFFFRMGQHWTPFAAAVAPPILSI